MTGPERMVRSYAWCVAAAGEGGGLSPELPPWSPESAVCTEFLRTRHAIRTTARCRGARSDLSTCSAAARLCCTVCVEQECRTLARCVRSNRRQAQPPDNTNHQALGLLHTKGPLHIMHRPPPASLQCVCLTGWVQFRRPLPSPPLLSSPTQTVNSLAGHRLRPPPPHTHHAVHQHLCLPTLTQPYVHTGHWLQHRRQWGSALSAAPQDLPVPPESQGRGARWQGSQVGVACVVVRLGLVCVQHTCWLPCTSNQPPFPVRNCWCRCRCAAALPRIYAGSVSSVAGSSH